MVAVTLTHRQRCHGFGRDIRVCPPVGPPATAIFICGTGISALVRRMKHLLSTALLVALSFSVAGCAATPDPAKVCTSEWIGKRTDKAVSRIERKAGKSLRSLKKAGESWAKGKTPNPLQMLALNNSVKSLGKELKSGQGIKDLKTLSATCGDPKIISDAMGVFLRKQGLPDNIIRFIEDLDIYQRLIAPATTTA